MSNVDHNDRLGSNNHTEDERRLFNPYDYTNVPPSCCDLDFSSGAAPPMLVSTEIKISCIEQGLRLSQIPVLVISIGSCWTDFNIKPKDQHLLFLTVVNYYDSSPPSRDEGSMPIIKVFASLPHIGNYYFITAVISCMKQGVSGNQILQLAKSIGHEGEIDDFYIKPINQHSLLLTGFIQYTSSPPSLDGWSMPVVKESCVHENATANIRALAMSWSHPSISDDNSRDEPYEPWTDKEDQCLLSYKKDGLTWHQTFLKFRQGRTKGDIRWRWYEIWSGIPRGWRVNTETKC